MTEQTDPVVDYLDSINTTLLGIGVMLKQVLDQRAGGDSGPVRIAAPVAVQQPVQAAPAPAPYAPLNTWLCPIHGTAKTVPAGVSKKTGRPYDAFIACDQMGCNEKPPRPGMPLRAMPPSMGSQMP